MDDHFTYHGRILNNSNYSDSLKKMLEDQIKALTHFDRIGLAAMPYIAAWQVGSPVIWYEFASWRLLELFGASMETVSDSLCQAIVDRRVYRHVKLSPDIKEQILQRQELDHCRPQLRKESIKTGIVDAVYKVKVPDINPIWLKDQALVTTFFQDNICLSPGFLTDVSKEMEQKDQIDELNVVVNRDKGLLVEAERHAALGQISAKVFHEIRNPISSIGGLVKRLLNKGPSENFNAYMEVIAREADRLEEVVKNLFSFTGQPAYDPQPTDIAALIKRVISLLHSEIDSSLIRVILICPEPLPELSLDQEQIHLALVHIIKNSIESMEDGGEITISLERKEDNLRINIKDSGPGIRQAYEKRVTEPFFTTKVYGVGLGLSLAQKAVQLHDGSITISRHQTDGTEVVISLPCYQR
ncbi:MAG: ATP-binding protein [Thermodesulfobacteriota bacterium]|nr:ATP-binding protein [Thermodesulfobacteriota bacterium]